MEPMDSFVLTAKRLIEIRVSEARWGDLKEGELTRGDPPPAGRLLACSPDIPNPESSSSASEYCPSSSFDGEEAEVELISRFIALRGL